MARRLAAIMAADMVGFSRLMAADENGTIERQKAHRAALIDPKIVSFGGRIVKTTGDGLLVEFPSIVDAVECAIEIQRDMPAREPDLPEDQRIRYRIGINLGDIVIDGEDIYGNGVNVAARLEALADPDGICISGRAFDQVEKVVDAGFSYLGPQSFKNIDRPVNAYKVLLDPSAKGKVLGLPKIGKPSSGKHLVFAAAALMIVLVALGWAVWSLKDDGVSEQTAVETVREPVGEKASIAVLPFQNISGDPEQDYFADGMTEDIITDLSRLSHVTVLSRSATSEFKGGEINVREVGVLLGVRYLIEGSVRKAGETIRINAQLVEASSGKQLWAERYDGTETDVFALQDQVLEKIVGSLALQLSQEERERLSARGTESVAAHDLYLRGLFHESHFTRQGNEQAIQYYEQALSVDPEYALPYARISNILQLNTRNGWSEDIERDLYKAVELAEKAVTLDPNNPIMHWSLGRSIARLRTPEMLERGIEALLTSIELDPDYADAYAFLGVLYIAQGKADDGLRAVETAMQLNPQFPFWYLHMRGMAYYVTLDYDSAIADFEAAAEQSPTAQFVRFWLAASYAQIGRVEDAEWEVEELAIMGFDGTIRTIVETGNIQYPEYVALIEEGLRKAGFPE